MSDEIVAEAAPEEVVSEEVSQEVVEELSQEPSQELSEGDETVQANTESELEEEIKDAIEEGASEEEVKNMIRQFTLKVDGKEFIKEIDLNDEEALKQQFQLAAKGQKTMQEIQELKKMYNEQLNRLVSDPYAVLGELDENFDPLKLSADYINKRHEQSQLSPEQVEEQKRLSEYEQMKAERDALKAEKEEAAQSKQDKLVATEIENDIMSALDTDVELVADRETVRLVAKELHWAMSNGHNHMTAKDVLPTVKAQLRQQFQQATSRFKDTNTLKEYMGKDLLDKLKVERMEQAQQQIKSVNSIGKDVGKKADAKVERPKRNLSDLFK